MNLFIFTCEATKVRFRKKNYKHISWKLNVFLADSKNLFTRFYNQRLKLLENTVKIT